MPQNSTILRPRLRRTEAFALVITLGLMAFVLLLLLSITTFVRVEQRNSQMHTSRIEAEQTAIMALNIALGKLQETAGPDQRVTSSSSIHDDAADGNKHWLGIWDNSEINHYNPISGRDAGFLGWLVSAPEGQDPTQLDYVSIAVAGTGSDGVQIFRASDTSGAEILEKSVNVPLVTIENNSSYAFWIEDEGVKASVKPMAKPIDAIIDSGPYSNPLIFGLNRGVDFGQMGGAMESSIVYPIASSGNEQLLEDIIKVSSFEGLALPVGEKALWLNQNRHDFTLNSHSLITDARNGGFKRDLSLAFEMDDARQGPNSLPFFNNSEFVGDGSARDLARPDSLTGALRQAPGHDFFSRYVYAYFPETVDSNTNVRGPTWHMLRDYYSLYKRLDSITGNLILDAQPYYPNNPERVSGTYEFLEARFAKDQDPYVHEFRESNGFHHFHLSRGNYTPVMLGYRLIFSIASYDYDPIADTAKIAFAYDPVYYLWNPYDKSIRFENYKVQYVEDIPVVIEYEIIDDDGTRNINEVELSAYLRANGWDGTGDDLYSFLLDPSGEVVLAPGEVRMFSAVNSQGDCYSGVANITPTSGNILRNHPGEGEILVSGFSNSTIKVDLGVHNKSTGVDDFSNGRFSSTSFLVDNEHLASARTGSSQSTHLKTQFVSIQTNSPTGAGEKIETVQLTVNGSNLTSGRKSWLGYLDYTQKTSNLDSASEPTEIMSTFNPISISSIGDIRVFPQRNRILHLISEPSLNSILPEGFNDAGYWGYEYSSAGSNYIAGFSIPAEPLTSLPQLRHGMLTPYIFENPRALGNSYANPRLPQDQIFHAVLGPNSSNGERYDSTWLLNDALWDSYFFSGIAPEFSFDGGNYIADETLESALTRFFDQDPDRYGNSNLLPNIPEGSNSSDLADEFLDENGYKEIAGSILMQGGFNINSTSIAAWAALLMGNRDMPIDYFAADSLSEEQDTDTGVPITKTQLPNADSADPWAGFSRVNPDLIWNDGGTPNVESDDTGLAVEIVKQVRLRGPFMSLSDFVNRRISADETGILGALQAAIKASGLNADIETDEGMPAVYSTYYANPNAGSGFTSGGINGYIEQADILQAIAPKIVPRSDTFRIRAYGESRDMEGALAGQATCEVVVQRLPDYVDASEDALMLPEDLNAVNDLFGRRFKIVSFRWL